MSTSSYKHTKAKRLLIPSHEEAGAEAHSPVVAERPGVAEIPLNPVVTRGRDPELWWMNKYASDEALTAQLAELEARLKAGDAAGARTAVGNIRELISHRYQSRDDSTLRVDIRSLYRHEHIIPENIIKGLYRLAEGPPPGASGAAEQRYVQPEFDSLTSLLGNVISDDELAKVPGYYVHADGWANRLIQGDSLLVMTSLLEREGMAGQVQCIYIDPPYGIKYGSNWQIHLNNRTVKDGDDDSLSGEPEQVKAFRDTWELGIHSYLSYLRERLLVASRLLHESGSCFVQISDENVHLVRNLMDEVFGSEHFVGQIAFKKTGGQSSALIPGVCDYLLWYARKSDSVKYRSLFSFKDPGEVGATQYDWIELPDGQRRKMTSEELSGEIPKDARVFQLYPLVSAGVSSSTQDFEWQGKVFRPSAGGHWKVTLTGLRELVTKNRLIAIGNTLRFVNYLEDFPVTPLTNIWSDTQTSGFASDRLYVVQTLRTVIERCVLMTTDPGDLVLDPTCGSGTTAYVAEQWGRRWITTDTSRIALNIAKTRLMTATFPYYQLYDQQNCDLRQGFIYKKVPHITLGSIANNEPPQEETLYDQPQEDKKRIRVAGPFTVETLQNFEPQSPESMRPADAGEEAEEMERFEERVFAHLHSAGIKTGDKSENAVFHHVERLGSTWLHAEGYYRGEGEAERKAYLHIGPKFGTVSRQAVNEAVKECRKRGDADWLIILGFSFESDIENREEKHSTESVKTHHLGSFKVTKARMHDDLMQEGLIKRDKKAASFVTIGEPDIRLEQTGDTVTVEIAGLDIYDPIKDTVKSRDIHDIAYWMLDDNYDGSNFTVRQIFFCGGDKDEFADWKKGLTRLAEQSTRRRAEHTLRVEIDEEAFSRLYGHRSHPISITTENQKIAVRVISQFGEETTKVLSAGLGDGTAVRTKAAPRARGRKSKQ